MKYLNVLLHVISVLLMATGVIVVGWLWVWVNGVNTFMDEALGREAFGAIPMFDFIIYGTLICFALISVVRMVAEKRDPRFLLRFALVLLNMGSVVFWVLVEDGTIGGVEFGMVVLSLMMFINILFTNKPLAKEDIQQDGSESDKEDIHRHSSESDTVVGMRS